MQMIEIYLLVVNIAGLVLMGIDKGRAIRNDWRIPEKTLFGCALLGGSIGCLAGMYLFRHKTKHLSFTVGMPLILMIQAVLINYIINFYN